MGWYQRRVHGDPTSTPLLKPCCLQNSTTYIPGKMDSSAGSSSQVAPTPEQCQAHFELGLTLALPLPRRNQQLGRPRQRRETTVVRRRHDRRAEGEPRRGLGMDRDVLAAGYAG